MPADLQTQLRPLVDRFVADLEGAVRRSLFTSLFAALGGSAAGVVAAPAARAAGSTASRKKNGAKRAGKAKRARRSPADMAQAQARILAFVKANPGKRGEEIKTALGLTTAVWTRPIALLVESKQLVTNGQKRATTYSAR